MKKITTLLLLLGITPLFTLFLFCQKDESSTAKNNLIYLHEQKKETRSSQSLLNSFSSNGNVVIRFYADWCGPCNRMSPLFTNVAKRMHDIIFININRDQFLDLAKTFNIKSIPTLIFLHNGREIGRYDGKPLTESTLAQLVTTTLSL